MGRFDSSPGSGISTGNLSLTSHTQAHTVMPIQTTVPTFAEEHSDNYHTREYRFSIGYGSDRRTRPNEGTQSFAFRHLHDTRNARTGETETDPKNLFYVHRYLEFGSYNSTNTVERSNVERFIELFGDVDGVFVISGSHNYKGIAIRGDVQNEDINETVDALSNYPVLDEMHWCELEHELFQEIKPDLVSDFQRSVRKFAEQFVDELATVYINFSPDDIQGKIVDEMDEIPSDVWTELFDRALQVGNVEVIWEDPFYAYVDVDELAKNVKQDVREICREALR